MNALDISGGVLECDNIDFNGKKVGSFQLSPDGGTYQIKNNLSKGLYFMQVNQGGKQLHCSKLEVL
ncbi:MAG: T9SS type A sorting domain-containing protein [Crocinitomicaceae bacterium]|nr:T9SS type A sorting domain-containing protein [Crocinitomicaceae bacterium]